jgi:hypothetical protein
VPGYRSTFAGLPTLWLQTASPTEVAAGSSPRAYCREVAYLLRWMRCCPDGRRPAAMRVCGSARTLAARQRRQPAR